MLICNERCRGTQEREPAHTAWRLAIQRYHESYRYLSDLIPDFCGDGLYDAPPTHVDNFFLLHSGYSFYLSLSVNWTSNFSKFADFRQLYIPNAPTKCYETLHAHTKTPRISKLHIDIKNLNATFRLCQKIPIAFEQGCTVTVDSHGQNSVIELSSKAWQKYDTCEVNPSLCYWTEKSFKADISPLPY